MRISIKKLYRIYTKYSALFTLVKYTTMFLAAMALWFSSPNFREFSQRLQSNSPSMTVRPHSPPSNDIRGGPLTLKSAFAASAKVKSRHNARRKYEHAHLQSAKARPIEGSNLRKETNKAFVERKLREAGMKPTHVKLPDPPKGMRWL